MQIQVYEQFVCYGVLLRVKLRVGIGVLRDIYLIKIYICVYGFGISIHMYVLFPGIILLFTHSCSMDVCICKCNMLDEICHPCENVHVFWFFFVLFFTCTPQFTSSNKRDIL